MDLVDPAAFGNPPLYSLIAVSTFFAIIFGVIFKDMLEYQVAKWQINRNTQAQINYQHPGVVITFLLTCLFLLIFLTACLCVFGFGARLAAIVASLMVLGPALLIWWQLGVQLQLLVKGGSAALDLDFFGSDPESTSAQTQDLDS